MLYHDKLVRDKIAAVLQAKGITCQTRLLAAADYRAALYAKLQEETTEFLCAKAQTERLAELADILEVIHALVAEEGSSYAELEEIRREKFAARGGFGGRLLLETTEEAFGLAAAQSPSACLFCRLAQGLEQGEIIARFPHCFALADKYAVTPGHLLLIPYVHTDNWFTASTTIQRAIVQALNTMKMRLDVLYQPDGYNVGINCGQAAGQTVMHLHVHLIPRHYGDVDDPTGGVRGVIPLKQKY